MSAKPKAREAAGRARPQRAAIALIKGDKDSSSDRLIYERVRLGILSALAVQEELTFSELRVCLLSATAI